MMTREQIIESMYKLLSEKMPQADLRHFHSDASFRDTLGLDSSSVLEFLVHLELEYGLSLPEAAMMNEDLETVRKMAKLLCDAQEDPHANKHLEYEEDIKLHCFVSCLSEVIKRHDLDQRALYFAVWDSEVVVTNDSRISYHSEGISHQFYIDWYERLYGISAKSWYEAKKGKQANAERLIELVEGKKPNETIMVMLDMYQLPERQNEFNKDPFPHYLMLSPTKDERLWFVSDPDYRWEGVIEKERILEAMKHPTVSGGYHFTDEGVRAPRPQDIKAYYDEVMLLDRNVMTDAIRDIVSAHLDMRVRCGRELALAHLAVALDEVPILSIRKYAYEHGFAFFWRELGLSETEFDHWCEVIDQLSKTYKVIHFQAKKLALTGSPAVADKIFSLLDEQDKREFGAKRRLDEVYTEWCRVSPKQHASCFTGVAS